MKVIVIAVEGWAFIGNVKEDSTIELTLTDASVIRVWGTTKGIGEIALCGPTKNTILDPCGEVTLPTTSIVAKIICRA